MRVYDYAVRATISPRRSCSFEVHRATKGAVVIDAQPVWDWFLEHRFASTAQEDHSSPLQVVQRCIPPFASALVEYRGRESEARHVGVLVTREETESGYKICAGVWWTNLRDFAYPLPGIATVPVSADGVPDWQKYGVAYDEDLESEHQESCAVMLAEGLATALLAFRFMNARGVEIRDVPPQRHERRRAEKAGMPTPVTYKTLEIGIMRRTLESEGQVATNGIAKAMHLCRGHFADYTKGKGLFGKHKVEVFVPEHVKGRPQKGVVVKDYSISSERLEHGT